MLHPFRVAAARAVLCAVAGIQLASGSDGEAQRLKPIVEVEEVVYRYEPANNGAGPMWCSGSTCLARLGDTLFASGLETLKDVPPLNNCRWTFWERGTAGWRLVLADPAGRTREPCPLVAFPDDAVLLSANPTLAAPGASGGGPARPEIFRFRATEPATAPEPLRPEWDGEPAFTEHSYRSFAADGRARELILFQNIGYTHAEWTFRDRDGRWAAKGQLKWPWGAEYDTPQPIRVCYPDVALEGRAVHFVGVSDIVEPYAKWRAYKKELTGRDWDYDFRRLFYTWTPDVTRVPFRDWVELASRDKTCGWISPGDLWVAPDGAVHLVWTERALDERLRAKFFPEARQRHELNYAMVRDGKVIRRQTLAVAEEQGRREIPGLARLHATPDARLFVLYYASGSDDQGRPLSANRLLELKRDGTRTEAVTVELKHPFGSFFTATPRAGSAPSWVIDLLGHRADGPQSISYARIRLGP